MNLIELQEVLSKRGRRTHLLEGEEAGLNVWSATSDRYPATTVWYHQSRVTGDGFTWGDKYQYGAPATAEPEFLADMIEETLD